MCSHLKRITIIAKKTLSDQCLDNLAVANISPELAAKTEAQTRGQSSNANWHVERCLRLQASKFRSIM